MQGRSRGQGQRNIGVGVLVVAGLLGDVQRATSAGESAPKGSAAALIEAPISAVLVYSDRARVARAARLTLSGTTTVQLPLLCGSVPKDSIRIEVQGGGAEVERVQIGHAESTLRPMPAREVQALLDELNALDDGRARLKAELAAYQRQHAWLGRLSPETPPIPTQSGRGPALSANGWRPAIEFVRSGQAQAAEKVAEIEERQRVLTEKRRVLVDKVQKRLGTDENYGKTCHAVLATLSGQGTANLWLSYVTMGAHWLPSYDIRLVPERNEVELSLSGLLRQNTGEDWNEVSVVLSTAAPALSTQYPQLTTWKLGAKERFVPTPRRMEEVLSPPPPAMPQREPPEPGAVVRRQLLRLLGGANGAVEDARKGRVSRRDKDRDGAADEVDVAQGVDDMVPTNEERESIPPPPPPPAPMVMADAMPSSRMAPAESASSSGQDIMMVTQGIPSSGKDKPQVTTLGVGLQPPPGYRVPLSGDTAWARAGGAELSYPSLYLESLKTGGGTRKIALLTTRFPVAVQRKSYPAMADEAYLVAMIKNPLSQPLPMGQAHLMVGADPAGEAQLPLVAPGEPFTLPLGIDRAIKSARNVQVATEEKGLFSKDEVSTYTVTTELVNPHREPIDLLLFDQLPLAGDKHVELQLVSTTPPAQLEKHSGALKWELRVPAGGKITTRLVYTLKRPKGARLYQ